MLATLFLLSFSFHAQAWSTNELHLAYGTLKQAGTGGGEAKTTVATFQHASGWTYGENYLFVDHLSFDAKKNGSNPFNPGKDNSELYAEWYPSFSLGALLDRKIQAGPIRDLGLITGVNWSKEVSSFWFLPGIRFSLALPGFNFANLDFTGYIQHSTADKNTQKFSVFDESSSWMLDFNWAYPFKTGNLEWSLEGHIEYIDGRSQVNTFGNAHLSSWILAQPQLRLDLGQALGGKKGKIFTGIEYQYWWNKLGEKGTDDNKAQLLFVWRL